MIYYVTRHCLSEGKIREINSDTTKCEIVKGEYLSVGCLFVSRKEWFTDRAEAVKDAERRRAKKIAALAKQSAKLSKMDFTN